MKNNILSFIFIAFSITSYSQTSWTGNGSDNNWNNTNNWSSGVPTATTNAKIDVLTFTQISINSSATCNELKIVNNTGGSIFLNINKNLTINGDFSITNSGSHVVITMFTSNLEIKGNATKTGNNISILTTSISTVLYSGTSAQSVLAIDYGNLTLSGSSTKTLGSGSVEVHGKLTINSGVTFSTPSGVGIYTFEGGITNNGTFTSSKHSVFGGSSTQVINGSQPITFADQVSFQTPMDIDTDVTFSGSIVSGSNNISFAKNVSIANNFTNLSTITFDGSSDQSLSGVGTANLKNLTISNSGSSTVTLNNANTNLSSTLTLSANSRLNANGKLTLLSTGTSSSSTARVATIPASATLSGNVNYQRYVSGAKQWHNIGLPISAHKNQLGLPLGTGGKYLSQYNEATTGGINQGWENSSNFSTLDDTRGYSLWTASTNPSGTIDITGPLNTGNVSLSLSYTDDTTQPLKEDGWNLVSNPYASQIDWGSAGWTKTGVDAVAYVWVSSGETTGTTGSGSYTVLDGSGIIASGQAFWVHANSASPALTATQSVKTSNSATFYRTESQPDDLTITMYGNSVQDVTRIRFKENAVEEFDNQYDGYKLRNVGIHNLSSLTTLGLDVSINTLPYRKNRVVLLNLRDVKEGNYSMTFDNVSSFGQYGIILVDKFENKEISLSDEFSYDFKITSNPKSHGRDRFELKFVSNITSFEDDSFDKKEITLFPNPVGKEVLKIKGNLTEYNQILILDNKGREIERKNINSTFENIEIDMKPYKNGMYFLHLGGNNKVSVHKIIKY